MKKIDDKKSKPVEIELKLEDGSKIKVKTQFISHKDCSETLVCETTLADGKPLKLPCELEPPTETRHYWHCKCGIWETGAHETSKDSHNRWGTALDLFRQNVEVFNSMTERAKFVGIRVMVPKEGGCNGCPLLGEKSWRDGEAEELVREPFCKYLNETICDTDVKHKECPAIGKDW